MKTTNVNNSKEQRELLKKRQSLHCKKIVKSPLDKKIMYCILFGMIGISLFIVIWLLIFQYSEITLQYIYIPIIIFVGLVIMWFIVSYEKCGNK